MLNRTASNGGSLKITLRMKKIVWFIFGLFSMLMCISCQQKVIRGTIGLKPNKISVASEGGTFVVESATQHFELESMTVKGNDNVWRNLKYEYEFNNPQNPKECTGYVCEMASVRKTESNSKAGLEIKIGRNDTGQPRSLRITVYAGESGDSVLIDQEQ